ncbi:uncharacterized protein TNCT_68681, partial [Trichonephila clavata]
MMQEYNTEKLAEADINTDYIKARIRRKPYRKSSRSTLRSASTYKSVKQQKMLRALAKEFIAYKVSAAGVPYIVNAKSRTRRWLWFIAVISASAFMGYMTINVIQEYLGYPKSLIREVRS